MKHAMVTKSLDTTQVTEEQLEQISAFARRPLAADEVYVFSMILCDNEIDRDYERFSQPSLKVLGDLFVGKTGLFDHNPKGENQTARIFKTAVEYDAHRRTQNNEPYCALRAWAYMVRCAKNADLILEIDAGIKKEVSVGCAVKGAVCSICGADARTEPCAHIPGQQYNSALCWRELVEPTDAYEWSFVAIPAQKQAGVTKGYFTDSTQPKRASDGSLMLTKAQADALDLRLCELETLAREGRARLEQLRRDFVRMAAFAMPALDPAAAAETAERLDARQLEAFCKGFSEKAPAFLQLGRGENAKPEDNGAFRI
ncbi:hypothetical protein [Anaerotruncus colihominis]|uniref:hypothetical protein n=1 Tax=Anaerotruncus colihominis TaxID=169435 RepID=UPI0026EB2767|nr:hypothetical protein [Anaerotruncus colihominis]